MTSDLYPYIGGIIRGEKGRLISIGGTADHLHAMVAISPVVSVSDMLRRIKGNSSKWINEGKRTRAQFAWQRGYGAFSVSESMAEKVCEYIAGQAEHHKKRSFKEEFVMLLKRHNVAYDERYVWD